MVEIHDEYYKSRKGAINYRRKVRCTGKWNTVLGILIIPAFFLALYGICHLPANVEAVKNAPIYVPATQHIIVEKVLDTANPINYAGGDGHRIVINNKANAVDPTYDQLITFLAIDKTDRLQYIPNKFVCADFAETLQHNAEAMGYKCGFVTITFEDWQLHACNVFNTADRGIVYIDETNSLDNTGADGNRDCIVNFVGYRNNYQPKYIFPTKWTISPMGNVIGMQIYWTGSETIDDAEVSLR